MAHPPLFVGRSRELRVLCDLLATATAGRATLATITGEPGIGKTRLSAEIADLAAASGARVLWGRCWDGAGARPYWPWVQAIRAYAEGTEPEVLAAQAGTGARWISRIVPELAAPLGIASSDADPLPDADDARFAVLDAVTTFWRRVAADRPLVLVLDDLHASDLASLHLLRFCLREARAAAIFVIATYREVEGRRGPALGLLTELAREAEAISLRGLGEAEVGRLVESLTDVAPSDEVLEFLKRSTDGNPFFVRELAAALAADGLLRTSAAALQSNLTVPAAVQETVRWRINALPASSRAVLSGGAVIGDEFDLQILAALLANTVACVSDWIAPAVADRVVARVPGKAGVYRFVHGLIRSTLYDELEADERRALHGRVAAALEATYGEHFDPQLAVVAQHLEQALPHGDPYRALDYAMRAAGSAAAAAAHDEACEHLERALRLNAALLPSDIRRGDLLLSLGEARRAAGELSEADHAFDAAADLARQIRSTSLLARAALGRMPWGVASPEPAMVALLEEALAALSGEESILSARVLAHLAWALRANPDARERRHALCLQATTIAERVGDPATLARALHVRQIVMPALEHIDASGAMAQRMRRLALESRSSEVILETYHWTVYHALSLGDVAALDGELAAHARLVEATRHPLHRWWSMSWAAARAFLDGRFDDAERLMNDAFAFGQQVVSPVNAYGGLHSQRYHLLMERGRLAEIAPETELFATSVEDPGLFAGLARIYADTESPEETRRWLGRVTVSDLDRLTQPLSLVSNLACLSEAAAFLRDAEVARALYDRFLPFAGRNVVVGFSQACWGPVSRYLGLLALVMEDADAAETHLADAVAICERMGSAPLLARAQHDRARTLADGGGDPQAAAELNDRALATARALGMTGLAAKAARLARQLGGGSGHTRPDPSADSSETDVGAAQVLRREGDFWTIVYDGVTTRLRHSSGIRYLAELLREPGREMHALELVWLATGGASGGGCDGRALNPVVAGDAGEVLDPKARDVYRRRLEEIEAEMAQAEANHDPGSSARLHAERGALEDELARAVGLGGRPRRAGSAAERARLNVTRAIRSSITRLHAANPRLGQHLTRRVRTGAFCIYLPDPSARVGWSVSE